jgi:phosphoesterase RecJ-like protein
MDTGWFRHSNTTAATFALAEKLVAAGARPEKLYDQLFERNTLGRLKLMGLAMGLALDRLQVIENGAVAYTEVYRTDYAATGALPMDTEDLVNFTRSIVGVEVGLFFVEQPRGGVKVTLAHRRGPPGRAVRRRRPSSRLRRDHRGFAARSAGPRSGSATAHLDCRPLI